MSNHITLCMQSVQQVDCISSGQDSSVDPHSNVFSSKNGALNLIVEKDNSSGSAYRAWTKRDATEGLRLPKTMGTSDRPPDSEQTNLKMAGKEQERIQKSINITDVADKFLKGTMLALSHLEGRSSFDACSTPETVCCPGTDFVNAINAVEYQSGGLNTFTNGSSSPSSEKGPQKRLKLNSRPSRPPLLPPCRVCGDRASGYHYGVNTCEACKGFFRRSICRTEPYICTGSGDCRPLVGRRTSCSYCRFKTCIAMGMSKNAIKTGRYTHELRSKNILEVKRLQKQESGDSSDVSSEDTSSCDQTFAEYQNELIRKSLLQETLGVLVTGQKMLYEFLDDYYNDDLIRERQLSVYMGYMKRKGKLLNQKDHVIKKTEDYTAHKECDTKQTERPPAQVGHCSAHAQNHNAQTGYQTEDSEKEYEHARTVQCTFGVDGSPVNLVQYKSSGLDMCSKDSEMLVNKRNVHLDSKVTDDVRRMQLKTSDPTDIQTSSGILERTNGFKEQSVDVTITHEEQKETKESIKHSNFEIPPGESLRAEVVTKIIKDMEQGVQGMLSFAKCVPGFTELPTQDQASLVKASRFDIWYIGHIRCFNVELRVGACEWQFHAEELAQVWGDSMVELAFKLSRVAQTLELTKQETAALRAVCLTFSDRCTDLQNRDEVEQMHVHMLEVFKFVSCKRHACYNKWFSKVINFLVMLREFGVKFESVSSQLKLDWSVLKDNPLLLSVFLS